MDAQERPSVSISGVGSSPGGDYKDVSISGAGKIDGDVRAERVLVSGAGKIDGSIEADVIDLSGATKVTGDSTARQFSASGAFKLPGNVHADSVVYSGAGKVDGSTKADTCRVSGAVKLGGQVEAEQFRGSGAFTISGLLSAEDVQISPRGGCSVREIGGTKVTVARGTTGGWLDESWWPGYSGGLEVETIEGDEIHLEDTRCNTVRGRNVKIGPGSDVEVVEYGESLQIDDDARVGRSSYTGRQDPPPPPRREPVQPTDGRRHKRRSPRPASRASSTWTLTRPVVKGLAAAAGAAIAAVVIIMVLFTVLPWVGMIVFAALGGAVVLLVGLALGLPVLIVLAVLFRLIMLPFEFLWWLAWGRRSYGTTSKHLA